MMAPRIPAIILYFVESKNSLALFVLYETNEHQDISDIQCPKIKKTTPIILGKGVECGEYNAANGWFVFCGRFG
ncbi:MAG: hypothetical protein QMC78_00155 [Methanocellales archaeon]|nr:hypothetical protein [Methanocellales archaeon]